jgi:hypothetical protein
MFDCRAHRFEALLNNAKCLLATRGFMKKFGLSILPALLLGVVQATPTIAGTVTIPHHCRRTTGAKKEKATEA